LPVRSCSSTAKPYNGLSVFDLLRYRQHEHAAVFGTFDLIELNSKNLRKQPIEARKHALANLLCRERDGIVFNTHYDGDGSIVFKQACALGCEGIVSKATWFAISIRANGSLAQDQEPGGACGEARSGRSLGY
jgi:ATP-dependent DNA ligase